MGKQPLSDVLESATAGVQRRFATLLELDDTLGAMPVDAPGEEDSGDYMAHLGELVKAIGCSTRPRRA